MTDAKLLSLVSISSLKALETVSFNSLFFVPDLLFFSLSVSAFNLVVALCSASLRLSKSLVDVFALGGKLFFNKGVFLKVDADCLKLPVLLTASLPKTLLDFLSMKTVFFPAICLLSKFLKDFSLPQ